MNPAHATPARPPAALAGTAAAAVVRDGSTPDAEALSAAREFERLLIHDLLKAARRAGTALGEEPSNARSTYDDLLDERLAGLVAEAGGLGLAPLIAERLDRGADDGTAVAGEAETVGTTAAGAGSVATGRPPAGDPAGRLATAELLRLRALVPPRGGSVTGDAAADVARRGVGIRPLALTAGASPAPPPPTGTHPASEGDTPLDIAHRAFLEPLLPAARVSARRLGTSADAVLAVAALESGWGEHIARAGDGRSSHNLFGIKARPDEQDAVSHRTSEYVDGRRHDVVARFRAFDGPEGAVSGFADFVLKNPRYADALAHAAEPSEFLRRLHAAGYATDPRYAEKAIAVMQRVRALRENAT